MCPERSFVKPIVKDFLSERKSRGEFVLIFYLGGRFLPRKPFDFEGGIEEASTVQHSRGLHRTWVWESRALPIWEGPLPF